MVIIEGEIREKNMVLMAGIESGYWIMVSKKEEWQVVRRR